MKKKNQTTPGSQSKGSAEGAGGALRPTKALHDLGQSLWLDHIDRGLLEKGTLKRYIDELSLTGLTSNPTIFDQAVTSTDFYDEAIRRRSRSISPEELFLELELEDLTRAADLFRPVHQRTAGVDGWVSLEISPLLAYDTRKSIQAAKETLARAARENLYIKIPGTKEGLPAIEEAIFAGVPVNVTLLFSRDHYLAAAEAYLRGIERRIAAGLDPVVHSVASLFISRWDKAVAGKVGEPLRGRLGLAVGMRAYRAYRELLESPRWLRLLNWGARAQRLLWASTGTKDPKDPDTLYISGLAAPFTVNTMPEKTLLAFAEHGKVRSLIPADGGDAEEQLREFAAAGVDEGRLAAQLQREGAESFEKSWNELMGVIASKRDALKAVV
jgi:transaldolase